ncbi:MAG: GTPase ObgE, partial [Cyclobacteriaceae bacterium]
MASSNFIDYVKFCARSGKGGAGSAHLRREKFVPKGGPDGGDGGRGGHIILRGNAQHWTLLHLKYQKHVIAENGENGAGGRKTGSQGSDVYLDVPLGTVARHAESGEVMGEITEEGQELVILEGGRGGLGNDHFKTPTFQTPRFAQPGEPGKEEWFILELKVLADVG